MNFHQKFFLFVTLFVSVGSYAGGNIDKCGMEWINIHQDNPDLLAIHVEQLPDNVVDAENYKGKHPVSVTYLFKGNRAHTVVYTPIGQVITGGWYSISENHWAWKSLVKDLKIGVECTY